MAEAEMTEITDIRRTKKGRFALFCHGEFLFSIDEETLLHSGVERGMTLDGAALRHLQEASDTRKAKDAALRYLSLRAYGRRELGQKLCLKFDEHTAAAAVDAMQELELLDDAAFARGKAQGMAQRGKSRREIAQKLAALGIDRLLADEVLDGLEVDEAAMVRELIKKKYTEKLARGQVQNVKAALARRGFAHCDIQQAVADALAQLNEDTDDEMTGESV